MIPRVADTGPGRSFKGAGLYYLHDKGADTRERVEFIHTLNLPVRDDDEPIQTAERALKMMAWTAMHQRDIRTAAGGRHGGEICERPVYTLSLSWREGETPAREHMIETAESAVEALGLTEHQVLIVGHRDTPSRHLHIIANLVHPETGKTRNMWHDQYKLSRWAEAYERKHGIQCHLRVENNARRARGEFVKYDDLTRTEWAIIKKYQRMSPEEIRTQRAAQQLSDREDMTRRHDQRRNMLADELVKFYGPGRDAMTATLAELEKRLGPQHDIRGRVQLVIRRLTGAQWRDKRLHAAATRSIANIDSRMNERRQITLDALKLEAQLLTARHEAQRRRDEALIAAARQRTETERIQRQKREKFHKHYKVRADNDAAQHVPNRDDAEKLRNAWRKAPDKTRQDSPSNAPAGDEAELLRNAWRKAPDDAGEQARPGLPTPEPDAGIDASQAHDETPEAAGERKRSRRGERGQNRTEGRHRHRPRRRNR